MAEGLAFAFFGKVSNAAVKREAKVSDFFQLFPRDGIFFGFLVNLAEMR